MPIKIRPNRQSKATHYDNLKVSEKAPLDVIKAAYRVLSMRWHPDRNPNDPRAGKIMGILNAAYEVLSDPVKREQYDAKLAASRRPSTTTPATNFTSTSTWTPRSRRPFSFGMVLRSIRWRVPGWESVCAAALIVGIGALVVHTITHHDSTETAEPVATTATTSAEPATVGQDTVIGEAVPQPQESPAFDLRLTNPLNGHAWPKKASYLAGFEKLATDGYSSVTVDNSKNTSDVFLKLVSVEFGAHSKVVRVCFIPRRATFTFARISPGRYELRYQEVEDGVCLKTGTFELSEKRRLQGVEYTQIQVPLYGLTGRGGVDLLRSDEQEFSSAEPIATR